MKKILVPAVLFVVLFVLPLGSWLYLKKGLDFRKAALKELEVKTEYNANVFDYAFLPDLKGQTTLIATNRGVDKSKLNEIYEQFKNSKTFQFFSSVGVEEAKPNFHLINDDSLSLFTSSHFKENSFILVDSLQKVRNVYSSDDSSIKSMVQHISILLPSDAKRKIKADAK